MKNMLGFNCVPATAAAFITALATAASAQQTWVWTGDVSPDWSESLNWTNSNPAAVPFNPDPSVDFHNNANLRLLGTGTHLPTGQDIPDLAVRELQVGELATNLFVRGGKMHVHRAYRDEVPANDGFIVAFSNEFSFAHNSDAWQLRRANVRFYGAVGEFGGSRTFFANGNGHAHFYGPVTFSGGFQQNQASVNFYGMHTTGATLDSFKEDFFGRSDHGTFWFQLPPGETAYAYDLPPEKGIVPRFVANAAQNVTVFVNAPVTNNTTLKIVEKAGEGVLEFNAPYNPFTGTLKSGPGVMILNGEFAPGADGGFMDSYSTSIDLNGVDLLNRPLSFWHLSGHNGDGMIRNQNLETPSLVDGPIRELGTGNSIHFGGMGDIVHTGVISNTVTTGARIAKGGSGTLTLKGRVDFQGPVYVDNGTLVLDYEDYNSGKIGNASTLDLAGNVTLHGNKAADTVETCGLVNLGVGNQGNHTRIRISPEGREGNKAVFRFSNYNILNRNSVDFAPNDHGEVRASVLSNHVNLGFAALSPRVTYRGASYAYVDESDKDADGYRAIKPLPDTAYVREFDPASSYEFVDVTNGLVLAAGPIEYAAALRFNTPPETPGPVTLTLNGTLRLNGEGVNGNPYFGGILVTPNVGPNEVVIQGPDLCSGCFNGYLTVHQYNTAAPLTIKARFPQNSGNGLAKTGPGVLVLDARQAPGFSSIPIYAQEGVLAFTDIGGNAEFSSFGTGRIQLSNATMRYIGDDPDGHSTDRQIDLRGAGVIEASGAGPLVFTHPSLTHFVTNVNNQIQYSINGGNTPLTLGGTGEGVMQGQITLRGGRLLKKGPGTWTIADSSHSSCVWGADIMEGTLVLDGSFGRHVTVHPGATLAGTGRVQHNLILKAGATLSLDPVKAMEVGTNLVLEEGVLLAFPPKFRETVFTPVLRVHGNIKGGFSNFPANVRTRIQDGVLEAKYIAPGALLMVR